MSTTKLTSAIDRPLVLCCAHGRTGEGGRFDAVLLDVARRADQAAAAPLRAEAIGRATCECLLVDAGAILVHGSYLGGGVGQDEEDGDRRPGEDDGTRFLAPRGGSHVLAVCAVTVGRSYLLPQRTGRTLMAPPAADVASAATRVAP